MTVTNDPTRFTDEQLATLATLQVKLNSLGVEGDFLPDVSVGPIVTLYRFVPKNATRVSLVERVAPDLAIALKVEAVQVRRVDNAVGIYVPNKTRTLVQFRDSIGPVWTAFNDKHQRIPILFGIDHMGTFVSEDLTTLPHLLIAGATNSGKSTLINSILASLVYTIPKDRLQLVLSDVKQVEFTHFTGAPHLRYPVATDVGKTLKYLQWLIDEINNRLTTLSQRRCQNILQHNQSSYPFMPYILLVIDELAEILMNQERELYIDETGKERTRTLGKVAEHRLGLIAQKARATGIHIIAATQRPSVRVVEGNIKANFPARVSFRLPSEADSRTILGTGGAEQLLSQGDMLYMSPNTPAIRRLHAPIASLSDIEQAIDIACRR